MCVISVMYFQLQCVYYYQHDNDTVRPFASESVAGPGAVSVCVFVCVYSVSFLV